jgi:hypothetical protein
MTLYVLTLALLLAATDSPEPVGMVLTAQGAVTLERDGAKPRRLGAMDLLRAGDRLRAASDGEATVIFLADGGRERLRAKAQATVGPKGCDPADAVERLAGPPLPPAQLESLRELARSSRGAVGVLRGEPPATPQVVTPMYGATVLTDRPALTWLPKEGADSYQVQLLSGDGQRLLWKETTKETRLTYPEKQKPLRPGVKYLWRVAARKGEDPPAEVVDSKFSLATKGEAEMLAKVKPLAGSTDPADQLLAATLYEAHGVSGEALALYEKLAGQRPTEPNFQLALASYYERAGRADRVEAVRAKAKKLGAVPPEP